MTAGNRINSIKTEPISLKSVLVVCEIDLEDDEKTIIGVSLSKKDALKMVEEYFGVYEKISESNDAEYPIEYSMNIDAGEFLGRKMMSTVYFEWFEIGKI